MAVPVKAYIDPTFLSRMRVTQPCIFLPIVSPRSMSQATALMLRPIPQSEHIPFPGREGNTASLKLYPKIPQPPMGRQAALTFPAVYKESVPSTGRVFPTGYR